MNKSLPAKVLNYLENKSYKDWMLEWNPVTGIQAVIVIPAINEFENIKRLIQSLAQNDSSSLEKCLAIFVVNNSVTSDREIRKNNQYTIRFLRQIISCNPYDHLVDGILKSGLKIGVIDASSEGKEFSEKLSGVGLVRKVGMDLSLTNFDYSIPGKKLIISLDKGSRGTPFSVLQPSTHRP